MLFSSSAEGVPTGTPSALLLQIADVVEIDVDLLGVVLLFSPLRTLMDHHAVYKLEEKLQCQFLNVQIKVHALQKPICVFKALLSLLQFRLQRGNPLPAFCLFLGISSAEILERLIGEDAGNKLFKCCGQQGFQVCKSPLYLFQNSPLCGCGKFAYLLSSWPAATQGQGMAAVGAKHTIWANRSISPNFTGQRFWEGIRCTIVQMS